MWTPGWSTHGQSSEVFSNLRLHASCLAAEVRCSNRIPSCAMLADLMSRRFQLASSTWNQSPSMLLTTPASRSLESTRSVPFFTPTN
ncbi:hypothetical protein AcW1_002282 [Taiwanofungus camphoratus]|nr:hypothetical protein AcW1_002282 [Antrodia cinnamomea]